MVRFCRTGHSKLSGATHILSEDFLNEFTSKGPRPSGSAKPDSMATPDCFGMSWFRFCSTPADAGNLPKHSVGGGFWIIQVDLSCSELLSRSGWHLPGTVPFFADFVHRSATKNMAGRLFRKNLNRWPPWIAFQGDDTLGLRCLLHVERRVMAP